MKVYKVQQKFPPWCGVPARVEFIYCGADSILGALAVAQEKYPNALVLYVEDLGMLHRKSEPSA